MLYLTHRVPYPPDKGDRIRNWNVLRQLAEHVELSLIAFADESDLSVPEPIVAHTGPRTAIVQVHPTWSLPFRSISVWSSSLSQAVYSSGEARRMIQAWHHSQPYDAVVISATALAFAIHMADLKDVPLIVDAVDVDSQKWDDFARASRWPKNWIFRFEGSRIRRTERELAAMASAITFVSDAESARFNDIVGRDVAVTATNGVDLDYFSPAKASSRLRPLLIFTGAMDYLPNIDAVTWFAKEVWREIIALYPDAQFRIVGRKPTRAVRQLTSMRGVTVTGAVPDVRPHLAEASLAVVPMRLGRGLQNKVLEAMAMGKAVIASPPALVALKTEPGRDLIQAETPGDWITAIGQLLRDEAQCRLLGINARCYVEEHHDWESCLTPLIDRVLAACRAGVPT